MCVQRSGGEIIKTIGFVRRSILYLAITVLLGWKIKSLYFQAIAVVYCKHCLDVAPDKLFKKIEIGQKVQDVRLLICCLVVTCIINVPRWTSASHLAFRERPHHDGACPTGMGLEIPLRRPYFWFGVMRPEHALCWWSTFLEGKCLYIKDLQN